MQPVKKILYATDLSEDSRHALSYAFSLAQQYGAALHVLHVLPDVKQNYLTTSGLDFATVFDDATWRLFTPEQLVEAKHKVRGRITGICSLEGLADTACMPVAENIEVAVGQPADVILERAPQFDMVVMGTQGHGRLTGLLLGSVTQKVVSRCPVPVLVVRLPEADHKV
ncbi:universal stress protein [Oleidesulfovibrio alaskensis]|uniref:universal stress protein n=1 Tax=Oleidesulfovibrio alaskensis TaxID=58180 RepID=UPI0004163E0F|nr:universal stress protein [Oleidesulfovibrio alaskensis]